MEDRVFKADAKQLVDHLFDTKVFRDDITRDDMNVYEDLITLYLQSRFESYIKIHEFTERMNAKKNGEVV